MRNHHFLVATIFLALNSSCSVDVKQVPPPVELSERFFETGKLPLKQKWWQAFNDEHLNGLIEQALADNFSLRSAFDRVEAARAVAEKSGAALIPAIDAKFSASRKITDTLTTDGFTLGLVASYELDLWGRIRANLHAAELDYYAAEEDVHTAAIALSAEIANVWYGLIEQRQQLALLDQQIEINRNHVEILEMRFRAAQASAGDVFQQRQLLESVKGDRNTVIAAVEVLEHQLAVLLGKAPKTLEIPGTEEFPALPELPQTGLTADLIQRRPDLRKAYFKVQAADQRIAAAIADRFPKISLSAGIDTSAPDLQSLFNNWLATLAGNLVLPIIDGHRRAAEVERNEALAKAALNDYGADLLNAVAEVENALIQLRQQQKLVASLDKQLQLSRQATEQIRLRYMNGAMDFLRVLSVTLSEQSLERNRLRAKKQLIEYHVALYRALAGPVSGDRKQGTEDSVGS